MSFFRPARVIIFALCATLFCATPYRAIARSALGPRGFINDWWVRGPFLFASGLLPKRVAALDEAMWRSRHRGLTRAGWRKQCGSQPMTPLDPVRHWKQSAVKYHALQLTVSQTTRVQLKLGGDGETTVWLGTRKIAQLKRPHHALRDDLIIPLTLKAGSHRLTIRSVWRRMHWRWQPHLFLRFHDLGNRVPATLSLSSPGCPLAADLSARLTLAPLADGFRYRLTLAALGSHRPLPGSARLRLLCSTVGCTVTNATTGNLDPGDPHWEQRGVIRPKKAGELALIAHLAVPGGDTITTRHFKRQFRPSLHRRLALARANLSQRADHPVPESSRASASYYLQRLERLLAADDADTPYLQRFSALLLRISRALRAGRDIFLSLRGHFLQAYRSPLDGRLQPYSIVVPAHYSPKKPWPLYVSLHGQGAYPQLNVRRLFGHFPKKSQSYLWATRNVPPLNAIAGIVVAPNLYRDTGARYFGRRDVYRVIAEVRRRYAIDPARIYLTGLSMGGLATFHLGLRNPTPWAALCTMAGYASVKRYRELRGVTLAPWERPLLEAHDDANFGINGRYLPLYAYHGSRDDPYHSEAMVDQYRKFRYRHWFYTPPTGHRVWRIGYRGGRIFPILARHRRVTRPATITFRSAGYRHRHAYWLRLNRFGSLQKLTTIRGRYAKDGRLTIHTTNLLAFSVDRQQAPTAPPRLATIDNQRLVLVPSTRWLHFLRAPTGWRQVPAVHYALGSKRPGVSGPIGDIRYGRQLFVYGTQDPTQVETNRERAENDARYRGLRAGVRFPVKADNAVTAEDIRRFHLILYGNPRSNLLLRRIASRLPVRFSAGAIHFAGRTYRGADVGVALIYPNPLNGERYVLVLAGTTYLGTLYSRYLPRWLPDFVIYDRGITRQFGGKVMHRRATLAAGYFDQLWRVSSRLAWLEPWNRK